MNRAFAATFAMTALAVSAHAQIVYGQTDDFQDGTLMNWQGGDTMTNISTGGPTGAGDRFLQITSTGGIGAGGRLATYNPVHWSGNYTAQGVTAVSAWFRNLGSTEIHLRVVVHDIDFTSTRWTSNVAQVLPVGSGWTHVTFSLEEADLTRVLGSATYADTMAGVDRIMFRHQQGAPSDFPQPIAATMGIDMVHATSNTTVQTVFPTDYVVTMGSEPTHNLQALLFSDDQRLEVRSVTVNSNTSIVEYTTTAPQMSVDRLSFILECHANDPARQRNIELWNYTTGQWELVSTSLGTTSDSTIQVDVTTNPGRFINAGNREMRARTRLISAVVPRTWPRIVDFMDRCVWELEG